MKRRRRVGTAARARVRRGGPRAIGRPAADVFRWAEIKQEVLARAGERCQACGERTRLDVHHVVKRAQGGSDFDLDLLVALCRPCHDRTDAPAVQGRLVVVPLGSGCFRFELAWSRRGDEDVRRVPTALEAMRTALEQAPVSEPCQAPSPTPGLAPLPMMGNGGSSARCDRP